MNKLYILAKLLELLLRIESKRKNDESSIKTHSHSKKFIWTAVSVGHNLKKIKSTGSAKNIAL